MAVWLILYYIEMGALMGILYSSKKFMIGSYNLLSIFFMVYMLSHVLVITLLMYVHYVEASDDIYPATKADTKAEEVWGTTHC